MTPDLITLDRNLERLLRQAYTPVGSDEQGRTKIGLQLPNALADSRLRQVEILRRTGETLMPGGGLKGDQRIKGRKRATQIIHKVLLLKTIIKESFQNGCLCVIFPPRMEKRP